MIVGELPKIKGTFGCAVPTYHTRFANGVFAGTDFGDKSGDVTNGPDRNGVVYSYRIEFGNNQRHNNTTQLIYGVGRFKPCVSTHRQRCTAIHCCGISLRL